MRLVDGEPRLIGNVTKQFVPINEAAVSRKTSVGKYSRDTLFYVLNVSFNEAFNFL